MARGLGEGRVQAATPDGRGRIAALDGLRALAILGVLGVHAGIGRLPGGHLGVSVFFVLSGYLITSQLFRETARGGRLDWRNFYLRRAARLFPALFVTLVVAGGVAFTRSPSIDVLTGVGAAAFYVGNFVAMLSGGAGMAGFEWSWTLSLEEQFYLLWPATLVVMRFRRSRLLWIALSGVLVSETLRALLPIHGAAPGIFFGPHTRVGGLLLGAALAMLPWRQLADRLAPRTAILVGVMSVAVILTGYRLAVLDARVTYALWIPMVELCTAALIVVAVSRTNAISRLLSWQPLAHLGRISYGVYLWNVPTLAAIHEVLPGARATVVSIIGIASTLLLAQGSWVIIEQPVLRRVPSRAPTPIG